VMGAANSVEVLPGGGSLGVVDPRRGDSLAMPEEIRCRQNLGCLP
jgi:hypothetical protein